MGLSKLTLIPKLHGFPVEEWATKFHPHRAQVWMSDQAAKLQGHVEQLSEIEEKLREGISDRNAVSKALLQLPENVNVHVSRLEGEVSQLHKALQEKTEALGKAKRALKRTAKELEAQQKKQKEEEADSMKKAAVLQQQVAELQEENLSLRQQLSNLQQGGQEGRVSDAFPCEAERVDEEERGALPRFVVVVVVLQKVRASLETH